MAFSSTCTGAASECFLDEGMRKEPREAPPAPPHLRIFFSFLAEGGSAHDAEAPQGAEDVYDPDHRSVQVCLPGPHPVPPKLQTHLTPGFSSWKRRPAPPYRWGHTSRQHLLPRQGADGRSRQVTGSLKTGAPRSFTHVMYYFIGDNLFFPPLE